MPPRAGGRKPSRRARSTVPSFAQIQQDVAAQHHTTPVDMGTKFGPRREAPQPRISRAIDETPQTARARARRGIDWETAEALQMSKDGDDTVLLPYQPTPSVNPPRPRTLAAGYDRRTETLRVRFRDGTPWEYYNVPPTVWRNFRRVKSPGRFINRTLNNFPYARGDF
jgi:hypothetical protein